jgi:transketolase C-terminal domain/subunit
LDARDVARGGPSGNAELVALERDDMATLKNDQHGAIMQAVPVVTADTRDRPGAAWPVNVLSSATIKPLDTDLLSRYSHTRLVVVHDATGLFEQVCEHATSPVVRIGIPDRFVSCYGTIDDVRREVGLDPQQIHEAVAGLLPH